MKRIVPDIRLEEPARKRNDNDIAPKTSSLKSLKFNKGMLPHTVLYGKIYEFLWTNIDSSLETAQQLRCRSLADLEVYTDADSEQIVGIVTAAASGQMIYTVFFVWNIDWIPKEVYVYLSVLRSRSSAWDAGAQECCERMYRDFYELTMIRDIGHAKSVPSFVQDHFNGENSGQNWYVSVRFPMPASRGTLTQWKNICVQRSKTLASLHNYIVIGPILRALRKSVILKIAEHKLIRLNNDQLLWCSVTNRSLLMVLSAEWPGSPAMLKFAVWILQKYKVEETICTRPPISLEVCSNQRQPAAFYGIIKAIELVKVAKEAKEGGGSAGTDVSNKGLEYPKPNWCYIVIKGQLRNATPDNILMTISERVSSVCDRLYEYVIQTYMDKIQSMFTNIARSMT